MDSDTKNYEIAYLISPSASEDEVFGVAGKISGYIQEAHGAIKKVEEPKKIRLAYFIKKHLDAYFGWTTFSIHPDNLAVFEKKVKEEKGIMRHLLVLHDERITHARPQPIRLKEIARAPQAPAVRPVTPTPKEEKPEMDIAALDKKLEEILGK
ncbi:MAG: 30S ribosomal protein S6 [bacterium]|nr:30S ribosomal protein S6 [bacterium]